jgi:hypothetical protein
MEGWAGGKEKGTDTHGDTAEGPTAVLNVEEDLAAGRSRASKVIPLSAFGTTDGGTLGRARGQLVLLPSLVDDPPAETNLVRDLGSLARRLDTRTLPAEGKERENEGGQGKEDVAEGKEGGHLLLYGGGRKRGEMSERRGKGWAERWRAGASRGRLF